jgi:hypothetical protein
MIEFICSICRGPAHCCVNCGALVIVAQEDRAATKQREAAKTKEVDRG